MLIYNHNKEFIGIDVNDLQKLHYRSFNDLLNNCSDFADLFVKKPGYIHNFKNFKWLDFVMHSDSDESKVLISANQKTFSATLKIHTIYLKEAPSEAAYLVELQHLKNVNDDTLVEEIETFEDQHSIPAELPRFDEMEPTTLVEPDPLDVPDYTEPDALEKAPDNALYNPESPFLADTSEVEKSISPPDIPTFEAPPITPSILKTSSASRRKGSSAATLSPDEENILEQHLKVDLNYLYTPQVAADELGLPVDLIEEFIGDFITQSYEFKDELFASVANENFDNIKNLSHKLKGVAANLRIDDSFEVLTLLNTTQNIDEARAFLKYFYNTVAKLDGNATGTADEESYQAPEVPQTDESVVAEHDERVIAESFSLPHTTPADTTDDDLYHFDPKEHQEEAPPVAVEPISEEDLYSFDELLKPAPTNDSLHSTQTVHGDMDNEKLPPEERKENITSSDEEPYKELHYNQSKAAYELGVDPDFITELKDDFVAQVLTQHDAFYTALDTGDAISYKQLALELKGVSDNLRINDISNTLEELISSDSQDKASLAINQLFHYIKQL